MATNRFDLIVGAQDKTTGVLGKVRNALGGLAIAAGAAFAVKEVAKFEKSMANISTLMSGDVTESMKDLSDGIMTIRSQVPVDPDELGAAAYNIVSAGISETADTLNVLQDSAILATAGLGTTEEAVDLMTSAINAFGIDAANSNQVADVLFKTVKSGKTNVAELAVGFGKVAPVAKSLNISFEEMQAATAAVTTTGIKAAEAQTGLKAVMANLIKPSADLSEIYKKLGVESGVELIETSGGLVNALDLVKTTAEKQGKQFGEVLGSVEGLTVAESLLGAQNEIFTSTLEDMTTGSNAVNEAFDKQTETFEAQWQLLKNNLLNILQDIGARVLPMLTNAVKSLSQWIQDNQAVINVLVTIMSGIFQATLWTITTLFQGLGLFIEQVSVMTSDMGSIFSSVWSSVKSNVVPIMETIISVVQRIVDVVGRAISALQTLSGMKGTRSSANLGSFAGPRAEGGPVFPNKTFLVGEKGPELFTPSSTGTIIPNNQLDRNSGQTINITINGDVSGDEMAERLMDIAINKFKFHTATV